MIRSLPFALLAFFAVTFALPTQSLAADGKSYAGEHCRNDHGQTTENAPNTDDFLCPIVRDFNSIANVVMRVYDASNYDYIRCTMRTHMDGGAGWFDMRTSVGRGSQYLIFGSDPYPGVYGYYTLSCRVPGGPQFRVNHYTVLEN